MEEARQPTDVGGVNFAEYRILRDRFLRMAEAYFDDSIETVARTGAAGANEIAAIAKATKLVMDWRQQCSADELTNREITERVDSACYKMAMSGGTDDNPQMEA